MTSVSYYCAPPEQLLLLYVQWTLPYYTTYGSSSRATSVALLSLLILLILNCHILPLSAYSKSSSSKSSGMFGSTPSSPPPAPNLPLTAGNRYAVHRLRASSLLVINIIAANMPLLIPKIMPVAFRSVPECGDRRSHQKLSVQQMIIATG